MSEMRKYNTDALFYFPLVEDGDADFEPSVTPAAGDCKLFTDKQLFVNTTALILGFDSMSEIPGVGVTITEATGDGSAVVMAVVIISGTVGTTGAGFMFVRSVSGTWTNDINIDITGGTSNVATADSTTYDLAATAGLFGLVGNGLFAIALTPTEMSCSQGMIHIIDSATKVWEDQAIAFSTYGSLGLGALHSKDGFNALIPGGTTLATVDGGQLTMTLTAGPSHDNALLNSVIVFYHALDGHQSFRTITAYTQSTKTIIIDSVPDFTVAIGDRVEVYPVAVAATANAIRDAILNRVLNGNHDTADTPGGVLQTLTALAARTNNANLDALLGITDSASQTLYKEMFETARTGGQTANSIIERIKTMDDADIPARLPAALIGARMDSDLGAIVGDTVAADQLGRWAKNGLLSGTADSGGTTTVVDAALTEENGAYVGGTIVFQAGGSANNVRLARLIIGFVASTDTLTFTPAVTTGITTESYHIIPSGGVNVNAWLDTAVATPATAGIPSVNPTEWAGGTIPPQNITGVPEVDVTHFVGTLAPTPATTGVPDVNTVEFLDTAVVLSNGLIDINVENWLGTIVAAATAGMPNVNVERINNAGVIGDGNATPWDGA